MGAWKITLWHLPVSGDNKFIGRYHYQYCFGSFARVNSGHYRHGNTTHQNVYPQPYCWVQQYHYSTECRSYNRLSLHRKRVLRKQACISSLWVMSDKMSLLCKKIREQNQQVYEYEYEYEHEHEYEYEYEHEYRSSLPPTPRPSPNVHPKLLYHQFSSISSLPWQD